MMQLNRSKFMVNGGIGYVLKPPPMCKGTQTNRKHKQAKTHTDVDIIQFFVRSVKMIFLECYCNA